MAKKIDWAKVLIGAALISPLDEMAVGGLTGGLGLAVSPVQGPASAAFGAGMILKGLNLL